MLQLVRLATSLKCHSGRVTDGTWRLPVRGKCGSHLTQLAAPQLFALSDELATGSRSRRGDAQPTRIRAVLEAAQEGHSFVLTVSSRIAVECCSMLIGILADTHNEVDRTRAAIRMMQDEGVGLIVHCGDLASPQIVAACSVLPFYFVFGNHDADVVPELLQAAKAHDAVCLEWGGEFSVSNKRIAVAHGHLTMDLKPLLDSHPDYLLSGHSHIAQDWREGPTRRINPGALFRADEKTVAVLNLETDDVRFIPVSE